MACVYLHRREDNGNPLYIGISKHNFLGISLIDKKISHRACLIDSTRSTLHYNYIKKYGVKVEILHNDISINEAKELEKFYIKKYGRIDLKTGILVNMTDGGDGHFNPSTEARWKLGTGNRGISREVSDETRKKISEGRIGMKLSDEHKKNIGLKGKGRRFNLTEEQKEKRRGLNNGFARAIRLRGPEGITTCPHCDTTISIHCSTRYHFDNCFLLKMGLKTKNDLINFVNNNKFKTKLQLRTEYGTAYKYLKNNDLFHHLKFSGSSYKHSSYKHTEETKRKIGELSKGRIVSIETRKKISEIHKGRVGKPLTEEHKRKIGESSKGRTWKITEEQKIIFSNARKEWWRKQKLQQ